MSPKEDDIRPEELPSRINFTEWYNRALELAEIVDKRYPVKGTFVWLSYGLKAMKNLVREWDDIFQKNGIEEVYFPLFVPLEYAQKNKEWFDGFQRHLYFVSPSIGEEKETLVLRPTGEPAMYPIFKMWLKQGKIPIKIYQTASSFRYEGKTTHTMIRDREITYWYEIHTLHQTREEADNETKNHVLINDYLWKEVLCIPTIRVKKPSFEIFPGAEYAFEYYTILPDGRLLENGSVNNLGQAYAKKFELETVDEKGEKRYCWQVCTGNGARYLVASFALHGDARGLIFPPKIAPTQVVIIPILRKDVNEMIIEYSQKIKRHLLENGTRTFLDDREDITPGEKFHRWDIKGVPIRVEIGKKELDSHIATIFRRDEKTRETAQMSEALTTIQYLLNEKIPHNLYNKIAAFYQKKIKLFEKIENAIDWIRQGNVAKVNWCGNKQCFDDLATQDSALEPTGTLIEEYKEGKCISCNEKTKELTLIGRTY